MFGRIPQAHTEEREEVGVGEKGRERERTGHKSLFTNNGVTAKLGKQCQTITKLAVLGSSLLRWYLEYTKSGLIQAVTKKYFQHAFMK